MNKDRPRLYTSAATGGKTERTCAGSILRPIGPRFAPGGTRERVLEKEGRRRCASGSEATAVTEVSEPGRPARAA